MIHLFVRRFPVDAPAGRKPGHFIYPQAPELLTWRKFLGFSVVRWKGPAGKFTSVAFCPFGYPAADKPKRCVQAYWGVKADGSESIMLQRKDPRLWDWTFTPKEQFALRVTNVGYAGPYNMAGN